MADRRTRRVRARVTRHGRMPARAILYTDEMPEPPGGLTFDQFAESMRQVEEHAYDLPIVHWHGTDGQVEFTFPPANILRPTRCGLRDFTALVAGRRELVTCEQCQGLMAADGAGCDG
jgi:hypothetical protein